MEITASCDVWMMTNSIVKVADIVGYNRCHTPRHQRGLQCILGVQKSMWLPHITKVDLVYQWVVHPGSVVV
ncbi:hypothetical protein TNCV_615211 [Trichonephila clavipes]|nr:hypothetical protein TNCV_615211 [Trichonephila clavipes]